MKRYCFTIKIVGMGADAKEAWADALDSVRFPDPHEGPDPLDFVEEVEFLEEVDL